MTTNYVLSAPPIGTSAADYEHIKGTSYYRLKSDHAITISNGSMSNVRARDLGYDNRNERTNDRKLHSYQEHLRAAKEMGVSEKAFEKWRNDIFKSDKVNDISPSGALARYLVDIGLRDPDATYNVGETPKKKRR
jgi:hypothetical protein